MIPTVGIVLSGGASRRMGAPKALLPDPAGTPFVLAQLRLLSDAGCSPLAVVAGLHAPRIRPLLPPAADLLENPDWPLGRMTSVQTAFRAYPAAPAFLLLPVDAPGIAPATVRALLAAADADPSTPWRPLYRGQPGYLLWIPASHVPRLLALPPDARLDDAIAPHAQTLPLDDPALRRNLNTPSDLAAPFPPPDSP